MLFPTFQGRRASRMAGLFLTALASTASAEVILVDPATADPPGGISIRLLPKQPESRILDETGQLSLEDRTALSTALAQAAAKGVEIHTAILDGDPGVALPRLGNELVHRWTPPEADTGVLVLAVPGLANEPLVFIRSRLFEENGTDLFNTLGRNALANAEREPRAVGASLELAASLPEAVERIVESRLRKTQLEAVETRIAPPAVAPVTAEEVRISPLDMFLARIDPRAMAIVRDCVLGLAALVVAAGLLVVHRLRRPRLFPLVEYRRRFSAPYSGGNNARVPTTRPEPLVRVPHG